MTLPNYVVNFDEMVDFFLDLDGSFDLQDYVSFKELRGDYRKTGLFIESDGDLTIAPREEALAFLLKWEVHLIEGKEFQGELYYGDTHLGDIILKEGVLEECGVSFESFFLLAGEKSFSFKNNKGQPPTSLYMSVEYVTLDDIDGSMEGDEEEEVDR